MTTYPSGVLQNYTVSGTGPPVLKPVPEDRWKTFSSKAEADEVLAEAQKLTKEVKAGEPTTGESAQYVYFTKPPDICIRMIAGKAPADDNSGTLFFIEFTGSLYDGSKVPRPFVDTYATDTIPSGLKCRRITGTEGGQLYWSA